MGMRVNAELPLPADLKNEYPLSDKLKAIKAKRDEEIRDIFTGKSDKFVVIIGPCSADNEDSVCEYVNRLAKLNDRVSDKLMIIPRIYTNKPRTTGEGYKGMLHQPDPEQAPDLLAGIIAIRKMHIRAMQETYLTAADEMLYPENRSYLDDILSYEAIGARSVENQQHRLTASGMDIPIGMKNPTSGDLSVMLNSVVAAQGPHRFIYRGQDVTKEWIPVVPAQHYFMGGIWVDSDSRTSMEHLYAVGETSCNGVHGANRLASNSLLESLVFAKRAAHKISGVENAVNPVVFCKEAI